MNHRAITGPLRRTLTLPWLVFYGLGVTVGAGIFALIGEILALAGDQAPLAFLIAGIVAGATGVSYAVLVKLYPRAGGEAVFVGHGLGHGVGRLVGFAIAAIAVVSSATIAIAFTGYVNSLVALPQPLLLSVLMLAMAGIAARGIRESIAFAALITLLEVAAIGLIVIFGLPSLGSLDFSEVLAGSGSAGTSFGPVISASLIAFFAFIGFEDIENMAEETINPERTIPRAIFWTLGLTLFLYIMLALVAVASPARGEIAGSPAPVAILFTRLTGWPAAPVAMIAAIAMTNGILVQILMAARVLYGMANEGMAPAFLGKVHSKRQTPMLATFLVAGLILVLALSFPIAALAQVTSLVVICVFALVNLALFRLGAPGGHTLAVRWRWWGLFAFFLCVAILALDAAVRSGLMN